jgi:hypothetical protein
MIAPLSNFLSGGRKRTAPSAKIPSGVSGSVNVTVIRAAGRAYA